MLLYTEQLREGFTRKQKLGYNFFSILNKMREGLCLEVTFHREKGVLTGETVNKKLHPPGAVLMSFLACDMNDKESLRSFARRWKTRHLYVLRKEHPGESTFKPEKLPVTAITHAAAPWDVGNLKSEQEMLRSAFFLWLYRGGEESFIPAGYFVEKRGKNIVGPLGLSTKAQGGDPGVSEGQFKKIETPLQRARVFPLPPVWLTENMILARTSQVSFTPVFEWLERPDFGGNISDYRLWVRSKLREEEGGLKWKVVTDDIIALAWAELFIALEWGLSGKAVKCDYCGEFFLHPGRQTKKHCPQCKSFAAKKKYEEKQRNTYGENLVRQNMMMYRRMDRGKISVEEYNAWRIANGLPEYTPRKG